MICSRHRIEKELYLLRQGWCTQVNDAVADVNSDAHVNAIHSIESW